jgi:hypothetical protein
MFETWGPRLGVTRRRERPRARRGACARSRVRERDLQDKGRAILETVEAERPHRHLDGRPPLPLGSGPQPRHPGRVPGARLPHPVVRSLPRDTAYLKRFFKDEVDQGPAPARHQRRVARELLGQLGAEGVGRQVRRAPPQRRAARPLELQVRPRRAHLRHRREHREQTAGIALRGPARHRRQQARRLDQDPREDLRAQPQAAPRGARGQHAQEGRAARRASTSKRSSCSSAEARAARDARRAARPRARTAQIDELAESASPLRGAAARPRGPARGSSQLKKKKPTAKVVRSTVTSSPRPNEDDLGAPSVAIEEGIQQHGY